MPEKGKALDKTLVQSAKAMRSAMLALTLARKLDADPEIVEVAELLTDAHDKLDDLIQAKRKE